MKSVKSYIIGLSAFLSLTTAFTACQDDIDAPGIAVPEAVNRANTTIAELKEAYWQDATNYAAGVQTKEDGSHYIIKGRVISSDEQSNVFKFISIQDETGAITFSINSYNLYLNYRLGQEIVVDATGMYIGKYAGLQQFGTPSYYADGSTWQVGFMAPEFFRQHIELNGVPSIEKLDTLVVNSFSELSTSPEGLRKWQGQLVRFNNVHFLDAGVKTFSAYHSNKDDDCDKTLVDAEGNSNIVVHTSGYATFWNKTLPKGDGDIVGILNFYQKLNGASTWRIILNEYEGCMNFGNPTVAPGTETNPFSIADVIEMENNDTEATGWMSGYIVGSVAPGVETVSTNEDIIWSAEAIMPYTLVIAGDKEIKDISQAVVVELPANTPLRQYGNLRDNPGNYGKAIALRGTFRKVLGTYGVSDNSGAASQFKIEGVQTGASGVPEGDGTADKPYNAAQAKAKAIANGAASTDNVYVKGYIVSGSINMTYGTGTWTIANNPEGTGDTFELYGTYNTDNKKFTDENAVKTGDLVVAVGPIFNYNSKTPEMSKGHLVSINDNGSTTPDPTPSGNAIYSESFTDGTLGRFTTTVETSSSWTGWRANTGTVACAIANSFVNSVNEAATSWMISPEIDLGSATTATIKVEQAFGYYFPTEQGEFCTVNIREKNGEWQRLTLTEFPAKPTTGGNWTSFAENTIDISSFAGKTIEVGFKYVNEGGTQSMAWEIRNFSLIADAGSVNPGDDPTPPTPPTPSGEYKGDFNSFNGGTPVASPYGTYTNATGWTADWCVVIGGSNSANVANNPIFSFVGPEGTLAPTLNGNTSKVGKLTSPKLTGGCGTLTFKYGFPFKDSMCTFIVKILQNGSVVKQDTVTLDSIEQYKVYDYSLDVNVSGEFSIEIVNACQSQVASNKDRVAIWNLTWTD